MALHVESSEDLFLSDVFYLSSGIGRARFWLGLLGLMIFTSLFNLWLATAMFGRDILDPLAGGALAKPALQLSLLINLIFLFPTAVVLVKRLHDRNKGLIWVAPVVIVYLAVMAAFVTGQIKASLDITPEDIRPLGAGLSAVWLLIMIWIVVELGCIRGTRGVNRFGFDPLA